MMDIDIGKLLFESLDMKPEQIEEIKQLPDVVKNAMILLTEIDDKLDIIQDKLLVNFNEIKMCNKKLNDLNNTEV